MTILRLVCPQCRYQDAYEEGNLDASREITCPVCGFSGLPTSFELPKSDESKSRQITKIAIFALVGIVFIFFGIYVIAALALAALYPPIIIAAVIAILLYRRWKDKKAKKM